MKKIQCEMCNSTDIMKIDDDIFQCNYCGCKYTTEAARKLLIEIDGPIQVSNLATIENLVKKGFMELDLNKSAAVISFNKVLELDPDNQEALLGIGLSDRDNQQYLARYISLNPDLTELELKYLDRSLLLYGYICLRCFNRIASCIERGGIHKDIGIDYSHWDFTQIQAALKLASPKYIKDTIQSIEKDLITTAELTGWEDHEPFNYLLLLKNYEIANLFLHYGLNPFLEYRKPGDKNAIHRRDRKDHSEYIYTKIANPQVQQLFINYQEGRRQP